MSDQESKPVSDNLGDIVAAPTSSKLPDVTPAPAGTPSASVEAPKIVPEQAAAEPAKEAPKVDPVTVEAPKVEAPKVDAKPTASPGQILIMPPDKGWNGDRADRDSRAGERSGMFGKRRAAAVAAIIVLAAAAGAAGGALATAGLSRPSNDTAKVADRHGLEDSISRIDTEVAALRTSLEQASKHAASQISKSSDRLDRIEKAQAEPAARLAKLSETVEKLRVAAATPVAAPAPVVAPAPVAAAAPAAPKETTATVQTANAAPGPIPMPAPKPEVARLPTVEGWVLRDVANGVALIEGRQGIFDVYAGDAIPGLGRIDAIRKQDGRWVVITSRGLIVGR